MIRVCSRLYFYAGYIQESETFERKGLKYYCWLFKHRKWENKIIKEK